LDVSSASTQPFRVGVGATNALVVDNNGYVGIGITNPTALLHISTNNMGTESDKNGIYVYNSANSANKHSIITLRTGGSSGGNPFVSFDVAGINGWSMGLDNADSQKFKIANGWNSLSTNTNTNTRMTITTDGKVGIGTNNPQYALDVNGIINRTNTVTSVSIRSNTSSTSFQIALTSVDNFKFTSDYAIGGFTTITNAASITIPYSGYYKIGLKFQGVAQGDVRSNLTPWIRNNNSNLFIPFQMGFPGLSNYTQTQYGEQICSLSANDTISLSIVNSTSGGINIESASISLLRL